MTSPEPWAAAGAWAGAHATALFALALALALTTTLLICRSTASRPVCAGHRLGLAGAAVVAGSVLLFSALAAQIGDRTSLTSFDLALSSGARAHTGPGLLAFFACVTHAGDSATRAVLAVAMAALLLLKRRPLLSLAFAAALAGNGAITTALKHTWGRARPLQPPGGVVVEGFSFPSGHSAGALVAYGLLGYLALRLMPPRWHVPSLCLAVALILTVGASRVFIGAHFPSDVLAGFASGAAWLMLWVLVLEGARRRRSRHR